ncbi:hypothetical protein ACJMK2_043871 [Sinanodonta woodiana]|uniref:Carbohydrate sulfotransferase n=1 Tax=Sinanodonta woodiana TaxID=1069815 RepID=A0ABD3VY83_SINWO
MARCMKTANCVAILTLGQMIVVFIFIGVRWQTADHVSFCDLSNRIIQDPDVIEKCYKLLQNKYFTPNMASDSTRILSTSTNKLHDEKWKSMRQRIDFALEKCSNSSDVKDITDRIQGIAWTSSSGNLAYCVTPKVGCTYWKRVFRFIYRDFNGTPKSPVDIPRMYTHYGPLKNIKLFQLSEPAARTKMAYMKAFMFTRNPYTRLWSAYIDKYFLPDFWRTDAKNVVLSVRENATSYSKRCANDVTFEEFLTYVVRMSGSRMNEHYVPVHRLCSPCHMKFDYIGKQESFSADASFILDDLGLGYLNTSLADHVTEELKTLITYNFKLKTHLLSGCFHELDVARRLWLAFQINGYIPSEVNFPKAEIMKVRHLNETEAVFAKLVLNQYTSSKKSSTEWKEQRKRYFVSAYQNVPLSLLEDVRDVFQLDFDIFNYESEPEELFYRPASDN